MSITGTLSDFSLPEIFQFLEKAHKTGLLTLRSLPESETMSPLSFYIWVNRGSFVAAANQLNHQGLVRLIPEYPWVSDRVVTKLAQFCPPDTPFGLYLKNQGVLQAEQLEHLFQVQIGHQLCALIQLNDAMFSFNQNAPIPRQEMTGYSVPAGFLELILQKLIWLQKLFEARKLQREESELPSDCESFCTQLAWILDIAFFHSLNFSLFDTNTSVAKLSQVLDWCDRPYDLPKSISSKALCCSR